MRTELAEQAIHPQPPPIDSSYQSVNPSSIPGEGHHKDPVEVKDSNSGAEIQNLTKKITELETELYSERFR